MAFSLLLIASLSKLDNRFAKPVLRSFSTTERVGSFITVGIDMACLRTDEENYACLDSQKITNN